MRTRSVETIIAGLLKRAFEGQASCTYDEMLARIAERRARSQELPDEHRLALAMIDGGEARSVRALNLIEEKNGSATRYTSRDMIPGPSTLQ